VQFIRGGAVTKSPVLRKTGTMNRMNALQKLLFVFVPDVSTVLSEIKKADRNLFLPAFSLPSS
jgi:hypothetical protein